MKKQNKPTAFNEEIYHESEHSVLSTIFFYFLILIIAIVISTMILTIIALITIIGVELSSAVWGDYAVTYWLADLF